MLPQSPLPPRAISAALSRRAYRADEVRLTGASLEGCDCLIASAQGLFAAARDGRVVKLAHGFFFGIRADGDDIIMFEACDRPRVSSRMGRILRLRRVGDRLVDPVILAKGLDNQCHQLALFDDSIWVVDTANQAILQFSRDGNAIGRRTPFPPAPPSDESGAYLHLNGIARLGDRIAVMLHNGHARPERLSELAWFDADWTVLDRYSLPGHGCHDIVEDDAGTLWHCGSMEGELINDAGLRAKVSDRMTRGLALTSDSIIVGMSNFGPRSVREDLAGGVLFMNRDLSGRIEVALPAAPTDLIAL